LITLFAIPKPFEGHNGIIQKNAMTSWSKIIGNPEIIVYGEGEGISEACKDFNFIHVPEVEVNEYGTPLVNFIFNDAKKRAKNDTVCYINSDIILFPDFINHTNSVDLAEYLLIGRRWDLDIIEEINFNSKNWAGDLLSLKEREGKLHPETGVDYFVFKKASLPLMPPFAIGRTTWDNWIISSFLKSGIPVIDGTEIITIHQNHDFAHIKSKKGKSFKGEEALTNYSLAKMNYWDYSVNVLDSTYFIFNGRLHKKSFFRNKLRFFKRFSINTLVKILKLVKIK
tara:strand:- start:1458 stop:2306 length:849 start_codon:yes stop_codon:yes gene_type:complete